MNDRINKAMQLAKEKNMDALLILGEINVRYFTGYTGDSAQILILEDTIHFFTDFRYIEQAEKELVNLSGASVHETSKSSRWKAIFDCIPNRDKRRIGIDEDNATLNVYEEFKAFIDPKQFVFFSEEIALIRGIKDETEIEYIAKAAKITDDAFGFLLGFIKAGISENAVNAELKYFFHQKGLLEAFSPIVVSGANSSLPHGKPSDKIIQKGDFITLDFGCAVNGYCSDFTRTIMVGEPDEEQKKVYDIVRKAQQHALNEGKAGIPAKMLDNFARQVIIDEGYGDYFAHGLGHGVGLEIHEFPIVNPESHTLLKENMIVTVEPGIYLKGRFGVRIEDLCVVKEDRLVSLSTATKQLITI